MESLPEQWEELRTPPPISVQKATCGNVAARRRFRPWLETLEDRITPNSAPIAVADSYQVHQGDSLYISDPGVLANDSDADQDPLTAELVSDVSNGYLFLEEDGGYSYDPDPGFVGSDSFSYWAYDGTDYSNIVTVQISVTNAAPVAAAETYSVHQGESLFVSSPGILGNDSDADQDSLTAELVSDVSDGYLMLNDDGSFDYDPDPGFAGTDSFTYRAYDGAEYSNTVTVTIDVTNQAPVGEDDYYWTFVDEDLTVSAVNGVLVNDSDPDQDLLTAELYSSTSDGTLDLYSDGSFDYSPDYDFEGTDSFVYRVFDGAVYSALITVTLAVQAQPGGNVHIWEGDVDSDWGTAGNWRNNDIAALGDDVRIDITTPIGWYPQIDAQSSRTVRSISVNAQNRNNDPEQNANFQDRKTMKIFGSLTVTDAGGVSNWDLGHIDLGGAGILDIQNQFNWKYGEMRSTNGGGSIYVERAGPAAASLSISHAAEALEANIHLGEYTDGEVGIHAMNNGNNLIIRENVDIIVGEFGLLEFYDILHNVVSGSRGGIQGGANSPNSEIRNYGTVSRMFGEGRWVTVEIPLINYAGGSFQIHEQSAIKFDAPHRDYDVVNVAGHIEMYYESELLVLNDGLHLEGGSILFKSRPNVNRTDIWIDGSITMTGGTMTFGDRPNEYVNLVVDGFFISGGDVYMRINGQDGLKHDRIDVAIMYINPSILDLASMHVITEGPLNAGLSWDIIAAIVVLGESTDDFLYYFPGQPTLQRVWVNDNILRIQS